MRSYENCEVQYCAVPSCASAQEGRNEEEEEEEEEGGGEEAQQEGRAESALARSAALRNSAPTPAPHLRRPSSTDKWIRKRREMWNYVSCPFFYHVGEGTEIARCHQIERSIMHVRSEADTASKPAHVQGTCAFLGGDRKKKEQRGLVFHMV